MKNTLCFLALTLTLLTGSTLGQGILTPSGSPEKTMKSLEEIYSHVSGVSNRVDEVDSNLFSINSAVSSVGLDISTLNITVEDLNALVQTMSTNLERENPRTPISSAPFTISQPGSYYLTTNLTSTSHGIIIEADDVTLNLMGFSISGDRYINDFGIYVSGSADHPRRNVKVYNGAINNFGYGLRANYTQYSLFESIMSVSNRVHGAYLYADSGSAYGNRFEQCVFNYNSVNGLDFNGQYGEVKNNVIRQCTIGNNNGGGVRLWGRSSGACNGNTIESCAISSNESEGIILDGYLGECFGNVIRNNTLAYNGESGIYLQINADGNRIENNHIIHATEDGDTSYGIVTYASSHNFILANTCFGQTNNYDIGSSNVYGPIVTTSGVLSTNGAAAHPWANFSQE